MWLLMEYRKHSLAEAHPLGRNLGENLPLQRSGVFKVRGKSADLGRGHCLCALAPFPERAHLKPACRIFNAGFAAAATNGAAANVGSHWAYAPRSRKSGDRLIR